MAVEWMLGGAVGAAPPGRTRAGRHPHRADRDISLALGVWRRFGAATEAALAQGVREVVLASPFALPGPRREPRIRPTRVDGVDRPEADGGGGVGDVEGFGVG